MSVLKGEGRVPILFNSSSISVGSLTHTAYLARPDLAGEWPTIVVVPSAWGVTGAMKDLTRRLARQGFAAICPDLYAGAAPDRSAPKAAAVRKALELPRAGVNRDLDHIVRFITNPTGFWSSAQDGFGVLGFGIGGLGAVDMAIAHQGVPLAIVATPLTAQGLASAEQAAPETVYPPVGTAVAQVTGPLLGIYGREDEAVTIDEVMSARQAAPHGEWVLFDAMGGDFFDDDHPGFDVIAQAETIDRLSGFFEKHLPEPR